MIDRRTFLTGVAATGVYAWLPGCGSDTTKPSGNGGWDTISAARTAVRASPDHLAARAAAIIATKDFTRAVRFVRDSVAVVPPANAYDDAVSGVRWGADGALRAAAGTQRERADLLAAMLTAMGATATVKPATRPVGLDASAIYGVKPPAFAVDVAKISGLDAPQVAQLEKVLATPLDPDSSALVATLTGLLPAGAAMAMTPFDGVAPTVPVVEYTASGVTKWAFALGDVDEVTSAPPGLGGALSPAEYPTVSVRLLAALGDVTGVPTSQQPVELVAGTWKADQVAGTRLFVTTSSSDPTSTAGAPPDQITLRTAALKVQRSTAFTGDAALWTPNLATPPASFAGRPFTTSGALFTPPATSSDPWGGPYGPIVDLSVTDHAAAVASVASLQVTASGGAFPDVQLSIAALDQGGAPVYGLTSKDFTVTDEHNQQAPTLLGNAKPAPLKVMLAYDCSGSVTWPAPADRDAFNLALASGLVAAAGTTPYELGVATIGTSPASYAAPDASMIMSYVSGCVGFSDIWLTLGDVALGDGASAVIVVSDFQASDQASDIPAFQQRLAASGLPVALVPVGPMIDQTTIDAISGLTKASVLDRASATFQQQLADFVSAVIAKAVGAPYRGGYHLPSAQQANQGTRAMGVSLASTSVAASATYAVPPAAMRGIAGIRGLYLEMQIGGSMTVRRHLAGPALDRFGVAVTPTQADYEATRQLLDGLVTVAFEPGTPTPGANVEDMFSGMLSMRPVLDFGGKAASDVLLTGSMIRPYSSRLASMMSPPPNPGTIVAVPKWMRVIVMIESSSSDAFERHFDLVPDLNLTQAATTDAGAAFAATLAATVPFSVREGVVLAGSSASQISGATLQYLSPTASPSTLTGFSPDDLTAWSRVLDQYGNWHKLIPTTPSLNAMWIIDPATGSATAVDVDGSGGSCGKSAANAAFQAALAVYQVYAAYTALECDVGARKGFACDGAIVGSVGAATAAIFAGVLLDGETGFDIFVAAVSMFIGNIAAAAGFGIAAFSVAVTTIEIIESIKKDC